jgi:hypothetical protein
MNLKIGRGAYEPNDRMEAELAAWLCRFEPAGTPIALRLRTFADLAEEAERPRRRLPWLMPALSSAASLAAVVLGLGLIAALAIASASASLGHGVGSTVQPYPGGQLQPPEVDGMVAITRDPVALLVLIVVSGLAGGSVLLRRVRAIASLLAFGGGGAAPAAPLPLRRPWRSIPRLTWLLAALTVIVVLLTIRLAVQQSSRLSSADPWELVTFLSLFSQIVAAPLALVVAWRYPRRDRSSRLLLLFALASLATLLYFQATSSLGATWLWWPGLLLFMILGAVGMILLAAGLAGRCGAVRRPPLWLAALAVGGTLFLVMYSWMDAFFSFRYLPPLELAAVAAEEWVAAAGWLAIMWVGLNACRRGGSWAWGLVLVTGALQASTYSIRLFQIGTDLLGLTIGPDQWDALWNLGSLWMVLGTILSTAALLAALLIGLRPVPPDDPEPAEPAEPAPAT